MEVSSNQGSEHSDEEGDVRSIGSDTTTGIDNGWTAREYIQLQYIQLQF